MKKIKILFVNANIYSQIRDIYTPLWPGYLASYLEKHLGADPFEFRFLRTDELDVELESFRPDILAISSTSSNFNHAIKCASQAKARNIAVVIGGIHVTYLPQCITHDMDVGCIGEGEQTFLELVKLFMEHGDFPKKLLPCVDGIVFRDENGNLIRTTPRALIQELDEIPHPNRRMIGYKSREYIFTSRGCPYKCIFCVSSRYWAKVRYASVKYVIEEIRELIANGVEIIHFFDDLFVANKKRVQEIADQIIANDFHKKASFICYARANTVDENVAKVLKEMNVSAVGIGFETGSKRMLQYLKGNTVTIEDNWRSVEILKRAKLRVLGNFMIGSPDETEEEIMETYDFIAKSGVDSIDVAIITPYPGTPLWDYALSKGKVFENMNWDDLNNTDGQGTGVIISERLSREELIRLYKKFVKLNLWVKIKSLPNYPYSMTHMVKVAFRFFLRNYRLLLSS